MMNTDMMKSKNKDAEITPDIIVLYSVRYTLDWYMEEKHEIDLNEISGFELHLRGRSWHVVVVTKKNSDKYGPITYELSHFVDVRNVRKILCHPRARVNSIVNYWRTDNEFFCEQIHQLLQPIVLNNTQTP